MTHDFAHSEPKYKVVQSSNDMQGHKVQQLEWYLPKNVKWFSKIIQQMHFLERIRVICALLCFDAGQNVQ